MQSIYILIEQIKKECSFETARSGGKGGQHVNKTESKVTFVWNFCSSNLLDDKQKTKIAEKCKTYVSGDFIRISVQETRSQLKNKKKTFYKLKELLEIALKKEKKRVKTKTPKSVIRKRLDNKKKNSDLKKSRKKIDF
jgi:ribosome-associated protein